MIGRTAWLIAVMPLNVVLDSIRALATPTASWFVTTVPWLAAPIVAVWLALALGCSQPPKA
jgi:hypothetical protein